MKTDRQLKKINPDLFHVAREGGTERPYTGKYIEPNSAGTYHCAVCDTPLFDATTQFSCGSGWPAFTQAITDTAVELHSDLRFGMRRVEVACGQCSAHLGHVFSDGPSSTQHRHGTGERFCINSISLELNEQEDA